LSVAVVAAVVVVVVGDSRKIRFGCTAPRDTYVLVRNGRLYFRNDNLLNRQTR